MRTGGCNQSGETPPILTSRIERHENHSTLRDVEALSLESMSRCARFDECSAPKCPLDVLIDLRTEGQDDPTCEMAKATRHKYWQEMPQSLRELLPFQGYFEAEYKRKKAARERWEALPDEVKEARISKLKEAWK